MLAPAFDGQVSQQGAQARRGKTLDWQVVQGGLEGTQERERQVSQAVGLIMERRRVSSQEAFELLRRRARTERRRIAEVARGIVEAADTLNALAPEAPLPPATQ